MKLTAVPSWPRGIKRKSAAARLLRLWVRMSRRAWMSNVSVSVVRYRTLHGADHSSRGVLPTVLRRCV